MISLSTSFLVNFLCPFAGTVTATIMWLAPVKDVLEAIKNGRLADLNPTPWAVMLGNCFGWIVYSFYTTDIFLYLANAPGFFVALWLNLQVFKLQYGEAQVQRAKDALSRTIKQEQNSKTYSVDVEEIISDVHPTLPKSAPRISFHEKLLLSVVAAWLSVMTITSIPSSATIHYPFMAGIDKEALIGLVVNLNLIVFYASPLTEVVTVIRDQSSARIHLPTTVANSANSFFWLAFGIFAKNDPVIIIPNFLGLLLAMSQALLYVWFPHDEQEASSAELEPLHGSDSKHQQQDIEGGSSTSMNSYQHSQPR